MIDLFVCRLDKLEIGLSAQFQTYTADTSEIEPN